MKNRSTHDSLINTEGHHIEDTDNFTYLDSIIDKGGGTQRGMLTPE